MNEIITVSNFILISLILLFIPYNILYRNEVMQIKSQLGVAPPKFLAKLLNLNIWLSLLFLLLALLVFFAVLG